MMTLPTPTHSFTIPSVYDDLKLDCRLYHPSGTLSAEKATIIAHPYAPLGGSQDDLVVAMIGEELLRAGYIVGTFNLRGAGESDGRTSWSGRPELGDFISFYGFILFYITGLKQRMRSSSSYPDIQDDPCRITGSEDRHPKLIIAGYSYGSVLATSLPAMDVMKRLFEPDKEGSSIATIKQEASRFSSLRHESVQTGTDQASEQVETADLTPITSVDVSYLLVSPVLPPVSFFAAMGLFSRSRLGTTVQGENIESPDAQQQLTQSKILSIYGDQDPFTSIKRLRKWTHDMQDVQGSLFKASEVKGAGHFWHGRAEELQMKKAIRDWITA